MGRPHESTFEGEFNLCSAGNYYYWVDMLTDLIIDTNKGTVAVYPANMNTSSFLSSAYGGLGLMGYNDKTPVPGK